MDALVRALASALPARAPEDIADIVWLAANARVEVQFGSSPGPPGSEAVRASADAQTDVDLTTAPTDPSERPAVRAAAPGLVLTSADRRAAPDAEAGGAQLINDTYKSKANSGR